MPESENLFIGPQKAPEIKPELKEGTRIIIQNKQHSYNGMRGEIIDRSHRFYRIKFENGNITWMPEHWVEPDKPKI